LVNLLPEQSSLQHKFGPRPGWSSISSTPGSRDPGRDSVQVSGLWEREDVARGARPVHALAISFHRCSSFFFSFCLTNWRSSRSLFSLSALMASIWAGIESRNRCTLIVRVSTHLSEDLFLRCLEMGMLLINFTEVLQSGRINIQILLVHLFSGATSSVTWEPAARGHRVILN